MLYGGKNDRDCIANGGKNVNDLIRQAAQIITKQAPGVPLQNIESIIIQMALQTSKAQGKAITGQTIFEVANQIIRNPNGILTQAIIQLAKQDTHDGGKTAAPPRQDGKIWSGVVTFTASKPVEVVVLHPYNKPQTAATNQSFGEPLSAPNPFAPGQNIAITLMTKQTDRPIFSGSLPFVGTALAFHTMNGEPFTVTYTLDAEAKSLTTTTTTTTGTNATAAS